MDPLPRHLALFIRSLGGGGGAERMAAALASAFARRGHRVDLVLGRVEGNFLEEVPSTVRIVDLAGRKALAPLALLPAVARDPATAWRFVPALLDWNPPWVLGCVPALARYLREERPDALLASLNYTNLAAIWARRLAGVDTRLVVSERNTLSVRAERMRERRVRALPALVRRFYPGADAVAAVSDGVAEDLARLCGIPRASIHTTYNPVVTPELLRAAEEPPEHPWLTGAGPPVLLAAGKLKRQKGFATLLVAFAALRAVREVRLIVLGEGPERGRLEAQARCLGVEADVALPGFRPNPFAYMARAACFALSSEWEGLPGVLIQALACGCPVVSTDCPSGPSEILDGGKLGPLVPVGDAAALARAIGEVLDDRPDRDRLRESVERFRVDRVADRTLELLIG